MPCSGSGVLGTGNFNSSYNVQLQFSPIVPIPAALWLFGGALAGLGVLRRRQANA